MEEVITLKPRIIGPQLTKEALESEFTKGTLIEVQLDRRKKHFTRGEVIGSDGKGNLKVRLDRMEVERQCQRLYRDIYFCKIRRLLSEDLLTNFIDECCIRDPSLMERALSFYIRFREWYYGNVGMNVPSGTWLSKQLSQKYVKSKSAGCVVYCGIALIKEQ